MEPVVGWLSLIDVLVVAGVALVLPVGLGRRRWWGVAAIASAVACAFSPGSLGAAALGAVWLGIAAGVSLAVIGDGGPLADWSTRQIVTAVAAGYATVAAAWFELSRLGLSPVGIHEPIVELTAVHFTYVGVGALTLALCAWERASAVAARRIGIAAIVLTVTAPVVVALGFVTRNAGAQIGGAVLVSVAVFCTAGLELAHAARRVPAPERLALLVSGLAVWAPMVLAVQWATAQHLGIPALGIDAMVRTHGTLNAIGFVGAGLLAVALERRREGSMVEELAWR